MASKSWYNEWEEDNEEIREEQGQFFQQTRNLPQENLNEKLFQENENGQLEFILPKNNTSEEEAE